MLFSLILIAVRAMTGGGVDGLLASGLWEIGGALLIGALVVLPMISAYTVLAYVVFRGKATDLRYG